MSLIASASVWTNDDTSTTNKKRIPTMRRPSRKPTTIPEDIECESASGSVGWKSDSKLGSEDLFINDDNTYQEISADQNAQSQRNARVNQLLDQLTDTNDGNKLADFQPLTPPVLQPNRSVFTQVASTTSSNPMQIPPPTVIQQSSHFMPISTDLVNNTNTNPYGNYKNVYDPEAVAQMQKSSNTTSQTTDNKLMDKINYMVHMLEQQQNEKTSNITEEFILYTFLGVFIIFIVDSFARSGRYTR